MISRFEALTSIRHDEHMSISKRVTINFEPEINKALRLRAAASGRSISDLVNEVVRLALAEDAANQSAFDRPKPERSESFDSLVLRMQRRGLV